MDSQSCSVSGPTRICRPAFLAIDDITLAKGRHLTESNKTVEGYVTYVAYCPKPTFPSVEVPWDVEFPRVALESRVEGTLIVQVVCTISQDIDKTLLHAKSVVDLIIRELVFRFSCSIGTPIQCEFSIPYIDSHGVPMSRVSTSIRSGWRASNNAIENPGMSEVTEVITAARDLSNPQRGSDRELYRSALTANDPVARFILLYAALQQIIDVEYQDDVDNWIRAHAEQKAQEMPKLHKHKKAAKQSADSKTETEYTSTRDSLGHVRQQQTTFSAALRDAKRLRSQLEHLVTLAISQKYPRRS